MHRSSYIVAILALFVSLLSAGCDQETVSIAPAVPLATATPVGTTTNPTARVGNGGPQEDAWITLPSLRGGARQETGVVSVDGEIWVLGGFDAAGRIVARIEIYDPRGGEWRRGPDLPLPMHHANVAVIDRTVYVAGFLTGPTFAANGTVFALAPSGSWERRQSMPDGTHRGASGVTVADGKLYVAGGFRRFAVDDFSVYDPATDRWTGLADVPVPADHLVAEAIDGIVYVAGGRGGGISSHRPRLDAYDPATGGWSIRAPMPTSRAGAAAAVLDGHLYVFGGEGNDADATGVFPETESYDPAEDRWSTHPSMPTPRHGTGAAAVGKILYVPGGADVEGFGAVAVTEAFTPPERPMMFPDG
ncbi:MAG: kelch repeat-containing protein [Dehalococcoidia bacterium]